MPDEVKAGEGDLESSHRHRCAPGVQFPPTHPHHQHHQHHHHYDYHSISIIKHYHDICRCHHHLRQVLVFIDVKWGSCPQVHFPPTWPTACNLGVWPEGAPYSVSAYKIASGIGKIPLVLRSVSKSVYRGISRQAGPPERLGLISTLHLYDA